MFWYKLSCVLLMYGSWCHGTAIRQNLGLCLPILPEREQYSISETVCAAYTHLHRGLAFSYNSPTCTIHGPQMYTETDQTIFVPMKVPTQLEDVAFMKPTYSSGDHSRFPKHWAVDGDETTLYHSREPYEKPWWIVDFLSFYKIVTVVVFPRQDNFVNRFHYVELRIGHTLTLDGDFSTWELFHLYIGPYGREQGHLNFTPAVGICGRYMSIQRVADGTYPPLNILDVRVLAQAP